MPEVVKRIGEHIELVFHVGQSADGTCYSWLDEIRLPGGIVIREWIAIATTDGWRKQSHEELALLQDLDDKYSDGVAASDSAREAIERERADLRREDAERIGDIIRESRS